MIITPFLFLLFFLSSFSHSQPLGGIFIDCGSTTGSIYNGTEWVPDVNYISTGSSRNITAQGLYPYLETVRTFPLQNNLFKKFCYEIPMVNRNMKHLVRTTYFYGGVNGNLGNPPVFDQIVDGTVWSIVNTTNDYLNGDVSYYEGIFMPTGKNLSVCLAADTYTESDPFISSLEVVPLWDQVYNTTNFKNNAFSLVARHSFGASGPVIQYPDDQFNRYWEPFGENTNPPSNSANLAVSGIWNLPPSRVFQTYMGPSIAEPMTLLWPPGSLPQAEYYIALYFADDQTNTLNSSRAIDIAINGVTYYNDLIPSPAGIAVFVNQWPLSGITNITLTPAPGSNFGPLINAGEVFQLLPAGEKTHTADVIGMLGMRTSFWNHPADWNGDPCLPRRFTWTGVTCSYGGNRIRVLSLNLTSMGLHGSIPPEIRRMTALTSILLGNNSLSGTIPDLSSLRVLQILHLEDNILGGIIPSSLGNISSLTEVFLYNNNLTGHIPTNLLGRPGLTLRYTPGNPFLIHPQA